MFLGRGVREECLPFLDNGFVTRHSPGDDDVVSVTVDEPSEYVEGCFTLLVRSRGRENFMELRGGD
jgi:hypothetical protein